MEIWKDIKGYENQYQVSNLGRVRSLDRIGKNGYSYKGKMLKPRSNKRGYINACISVLENGNYQNDFGMRPISKWENGKGFGWTFDKRIKMIYTFTMEKDIIKTYLYGGDSYGVLWEYKVPQNVTAKEISERFITEVNNNISRILSK